MITAFAGPKAAEAFQKDVGSWRWAFGTFAIITPFMAIPLYTILRLNLNKAKKAGVMPDESVSSGRTFLQTLHHVAVEFDSKSILRFYRFIGTFVRFLLYNQLTYTLSQSSASSSSPAVS
jgi:hypothetical protein